MPEYGGIQRITCTVATALASLHHLKCYSAYYLEYSKGKDGTVFEKEAKITSEKELAGFVEENEIDVIVNQHSVRFLKWCKNVKRAKKIFAFHTIVDLRDYLLVPETIFFDIKYRNGLRRLKMTVKLLMLPVLRKIYSAKNRKLQNEILEISDALVFLANGNKTRFFDRYGQQSFDARKVAVIANALSFDDFFEMASYKNEKRKEVLIVSRLMETPKKISTALRIWREIEKDDLYDDWKLTIVGDGEDIDIYKNMCIKFCLKRVSFEGKRNPQEYYRRASIFWMTSAFEGFGLTLTESQQYACVPIALNTYPALSDIISPWNNGVIVDKDRLDSYVQVTKKLMRNETLRMGLAKNAVNSARLFSVGKIADKWFNLIQSICGENF